MMKRRIGMMLLFLVLCMAVGGCATEKIPAKLFFINIFHDIVDVRLGPEDHPVYRALAVRPASYSPLSPTSLFGGYPLYFKPTTSERWNTWSFNDQDSICNVEPAMIYCIVIAGDGTLNFYTMREKPGPGARICFLNASHVRVARMWISGRTFENRAAGAENMDSNTLSNFITVPQGAYMLFWQFPFQEDTEEYLYFSRNQRNIPEQLPLQNGHYYIFCIYTENDAVNPLFFDVTSGTAP
jgi:hypothetical protein